MKQIISHPSQMGLILQSARRHHKINQAALAKMLNASQPAVSRLEIHPESIKLAALLKMLHRYGLELTISDRPQSQPPQTDSRDGESW